MFKFGFFYTPSETVAEENSTAEKQWREAEKIIPKNFNLTEQENFNISENKYGDVTIKTFSETDIIVNLKMQDDLNCILKADMDHSDLISAEYEGGLKIWECTIDLVNYMNNENIEFKDKRVLDLGCGCGILGIYTLLKGATVDFQDYNKEVIENITIPNVVLNCEKDENKFMKNSFYSGDWKPLLNCLPEEEKYDYILTSETIYNPENYHKLNAIFENKLKSDGVVYLAAKTYYFGVGGNAREFEKNIEKYPTLKSKVCWKCSEGVQREILKIKKI